MSQENVEIVKEAHERFTKTGQPIWETFIDCVRARNRETFCTPELGAAAFTTVNMGVLSYRQGKVLFWDKMKRETKEADVRWATAWETPAIPVRCDHRCGAPSSGSSARGRSGSARGRRGRPVREAPSRWSWP